MEKSTLRDLAAMIDGTLIGDAEKVIEGVAPIQNAASTDSVQLRFLTKFLARQL